MLGNQPRSLFCQFIGCGALLLVLTALSAHAKEPSVRTDETAPTATASGPAAAETLQARIARLIEQLGDNRYAVRQQAQEELARLGPEAFDALSEAQNNDDVEIASRADTWCNGFASNGRATLIRRW